MNRSENRSVLRWLPTRLRWVIAGAAYGLLMRLLFGLLSERLIGPMSITFLIGTPIIIGLITTWGVETQKLTWTSAIFLPWVSVFLMLVGCIVTLLEGSICIAMMAPLLLVFASVGGVIGKLCRPSKAGSITTMYSIAVLPLLLAVAEPYLVPASQEIEVVKAVEIAAPPDRIWREIMEARDIQPDELPPSISHAIGVPKPVEGVNVITDDGEVRYSKWERGVNFRAKVTNREVNKSISWHYEFDADSFPKGSMDEHVAIGGRYFDLRDTTFNLLAHDGGTTTLELRAHYRVTTPINFYAVPTAELLGRDFVATILGLYKGRSEASRSAR
jgi:hypothetical protein